MPETVTLSLVRPYASEDELVAAEGWAIDKKGMVLIGQKRLPSGTLVRFELLLENGTRVLVAEGKAVGYAKAKGDRPGGAKIRFKRFNAAGKAFIDRVLAANAARAEAEAAGGAEPPPPESIEPAPESLATEEPASAETVEAAEPSTPEASGPAAAEEPEVAEAARAPASEESEVAEAARAPASEESGSAGSGAASEEPSSAAPAPSLPTQAYLEQSGIRQRAAGPVAPPENRDELLEKLRERARRNRAESA